MSDMYSTAPNNYNTHDHFKCSIIYFLINEVQHKAGVVMERQLAFITGYSLLSSRGSGKESFSFPL